MTTCFVGAHYEVVETNTGTQVNKYYGVYPASGGAGTQRIAIPQGDDVRKDGVLYYILGDHLGSASIVTDASGIVVSQTKYKAWGEVRYSSGSEVTKYQYTGQYSYAADFGLLLYNARWYDPYLKRFAQADAVIPDAKNSLALDRYSYTFNNPLGYIDPSDHIPKDEICRYLGICGDNAKDIFYETYGEELGDLLWDTDISWGSVLMWDDGKQMAMLVLFDSGDEGYYGGLLGIQGERQGKFFRLNELAGIEKINAIIDPDIKDVFDLPRYQEDAVSCNDTYQYGFYTYIDISEGWWLLFGAGFVQLPVWGALVITTAGGLVDLAGASPLPTSVQYALNHSVGLPWSNYPVVYAANNVFSHANPPSSRYDINLSRPEPGAFPSWNSK